MKHLIAATCIAALMATQSAALVIEEPPVIPEPPVEQPETSSGGSSNGDLLAIMGAVVLIAILANRSQEPRLDRPRPQVRPQICMNKHGVIVAC